MINISFIKLKHNVTDDYRKTLFGWKNKDVNWEDIHKVIGNSKIQYSCYRWNNGAKTGKNFDRSKQNCIVIDVDDGMNIQSFQNLFKKYKYALGTTKSHQKDKKGIVCDRFRVVIPAINIPTDDDVYFRMMELIFPFNDKQTLTKTSSFLGTTDCIVVKNDGKCLDCFKASELAYKQIEEERIEREAKRIDKDLLSSYGSLSMDAIKEKLNHFIVIEILESVGYEFELNKFKIRDERTPSCKVYPSGYIKDYGGEFKGDIFQLLIEHHGMNFKEALKYVRNFI